MISDTMRQLTHYLAQLVLAEGTLEPVPERES